MGAGLTSTLRAVSAVDVGIQVIAWAFAAKLKTEKFYDLTASLTYVVLVLYTFLTNSKSWPPALSRALVNSSLALIWALRLGSFLFLRVLKDGSDKRFDQVKHKPAKFLVYWLVQAVWIFLTALPVYVGNARNSDAPADQEKNFGFRDALGWLIWVIGFVVQVTADRQKRIFRADTRNHDKWIDEGLWHYSQHPNYFGEMAMWWGIWISSSAGFTSWLDYVTVISPCFVVYLISQVSGIPLLRKANLKRWGGNAAYQAYMRSTSLLIPMPKRM